MRYWRILVAVYLYLTASQVLAFELVPPAGGSVSPAGLSMPTPSVAQVANGTELRAASNGTVLVKTATGTASGALTVPYKVPVSTVTTLAKGLARVSPWISIPLTIHDILTNAGIKDDGTGTLVISSTAGWIYTSYGANVWHDTPGQACAALGNLFGYSGVSSQTTTFTYAHSDAQASCIWNGSVIGSAAHLVCPTGFKLQSGYCVSGTPPTTPATDGQIQSALDAAAVTPETARLMLQELLDAKATFPALDIAPEAQPLTLTTPEVITKTACDSLGNCTTDKTKTIVEISPPATSQEPAPVTVKTQTGTSTNGGPVTNTTTTTDATLSTATSTGSAASSASPLPPPTQTDCDKYPNSIGCYEGGALTDPALPNRDIAVLITPVDFSTPGSCPAPRTFNALGRSISISYTPICDFAAYIKPVVLALAWLGAALIVFGGVF